MDGPTGQSRVDFTRALKRTVGDPGLDERGRAAMDLDLYLMASVIALFLAAALDALSEAHRWLLPLLNGFVMTFIVTLVVFGMLPHAVHETGAVALLAAAVGFALPQVIESLLRSAPGRRRSVIALLLTGLALHTAMDGAALAGAAQRGSDTLPIAVFVHRIPVGLLVWWLVGGRRRWLWATACLAGLGLTTVVGYGLGTSLSVGAGGRFAILEALVAGALLHVLRGPHDPRPRPTIPLAELAGAALAVLAAALMPNHGPMHGAHAHVGAAMLDLMLISAPALVVGYLLAGVAGTSMPTVGIRWASRGGPISQSLRGTALGLPIPICSCGVVPVYAGLHKAGMPATAGLAFLVATPELGIESLLLSFPLLGSELAWVRLVAAALFAITVGVAVGRSVSRPPPCPADASPCQKAHASLADRTHRALSMGFSEIFESTAPWIGAGLALAALMEPGSLSEIARLAPGPWSVILFAVLGIPLYVCASGATPLAAAFIAGGVSPGAALAFLLSGPATNVTTFGMLQRLHGRKVAAKFGITAIAVAMAIGFIVNALWPSGWMSPDPTKFSEAVGPINWLASSILALAALRLLLLRGPVSLVRTLFISGGHIEADRSVPDLSGASYCSQSCCDSVPSGR